MQLFHFIFSLLNDKMHQGDDKVIRRCNDKKYRREGGTRQSHMVKMICDMIIDYRAGDKIVANAPGRSRQDRTKASGKW